MTITLFTLFPEFFDSVLDQSMLKRAQTFGNVSFEVINIRDFALDKHKVTDDRPFGGGAGMVMKVEPIHRALEDWQLKHPEGSKRVIATSASGRLFTQEKATAYTQLDHLAIICGHYEGIDERVLEQLVDEEVRVGDYVLTGGEPAAVIIVDAVTRLLPGVLGNSESKTGESHEEPGKGRVPQYTRPENYNGWQVPEILLTGDHQAIKAWREDHRKKLG